MAEYNPVTAEVIAELEELYRQRDKHSPEMRIKLG